MDDFYRAKRKDNGQWVYGGLIKTLDGYFMYLDEAKVIEAEQTVTDEKMGEEYHIKGHLLETVEVLPETVDRCLGFDDVKGNILFENDFILCKGTYYTNPSVDAGWEFSYIAFVQYIEKISLLPEMFDGNNHRINIYDVAFNFEIIGNAHEDKEKVNGIMEKAKKLYMEKMEKEIAYKIGLLEQRVDKIRK